MGTLPPTRKSLLLGIVLGLAAFAAGLALARTCLPEWREMRPLPRRVFRARFAELAARAGLVLEPGEPQIRLATRGALEFEPFRSLGDSGTDWLLATHTGFRVEVFQEARDTASRMQERLIADFSLDGRPQWVGWINGDLASLLKPHDPAADLRLASAVMPAILTPGESLGPVLTDAVGTSPRQTAPVLGSSPRQGLMVMISPTGGTAGRWAATVAGTSPEPMESRIDRNAGLFFRTVFALLAALVLFAILAIKSRLGVVNGAVLAGLCLATLSPQPTLQTFGPAFTLAAMAIITLWIFLTWSCAESLLRSTDPDFTTSLDALRAGRLGPRGGRGLLTGFAFGAGLAGLGLAVLSLAVALPGVWPEAASFNLPVFQPFRGPVVDGASLAACVALALALALRVLPLRWAPAAAALAVGALVAPLALHPLPASLAANTLVAGLLVYVCRRHGLTALLTAAIVAKLLPLAVFTGSHLDWSPVAFTATAGLSLAVVAFGLVGLARSPAAEIARLAPPVFVRRLEDERRLQHEMGLLARMQRGLLPRTLPRLDGWEIAAHSVLANEAGGDLYDFLRDDAGGFWLAAGDVAGHGYSCAVAQAMTKAALASLIRTGRTPAEVLQRADTVLRAAGPTRNFTSLSLLRLDLATGEALLSNAGHPPALLWTAGKVAEIALPSLPLGLGPPRRYEDLALRLPPGASLVFLSDGLFEALDHGDAPYGYERARDLLQGTGARTADKILEALLADWRRHLHGSAPLDDTTLVVLRRAAAREPA